MGEDEILTRSLRDLQREHTALDIIFFICFLLAGFFIPLLIFPTELGTLCARKTGAMLI